MVIMDWKKFLYRFSLFTIAGIGGFLSNGIAFNLFVMMKIIPEGLSGLEIVEKTSYVFMATLLVGVVGVFIQKPWYKYLVFLPLYAPPLFSLFYILIH